MDFVYFLDVHLQAQVKNREQPVLSTSLDESAEMPPFSNEREVAKKFGLKKHSPAPFYHS
jgi:hypothetical protein